MSHQRKRIAIDNDDVLFPFVETFFRFFNAKYQTNYSLSSQLQYKLDQTLGLTEEETMEAIFDFYASKEILQMEPLSGAKQALATLKNEHDLVLITARPTFTTDITIQAVEKYFHNIFKEIHLTNSFSKSELKTTKAKLCKETGVSLLVDDSPINAAECIEEGIPLILFERPWNKNMSSSQFLPDMLYLAQTWPEVVALIQQISKLQKSR